MINNENNNDTPILLTNNINENNNENNNDTPVAYCYNGPLPPRRPGNKADGVVYMICTYVCIYIYIYDVHIMYNSNDNNDNTLDAPRLMMIIE